MALNPAPLYYPAHGQGQPRPNQPGNPFGPQQSRMDPPNWNPGGILPGVTTARGLERWTGIQGQQFQLVADTNQEWFWQSPLLDLRPGAAQADGFPQNAVPVNHEGALGLGIYLSVLIVSMGGTHPPATIPFMTVTAWETGNNQASDAVYQLTPETDITEQVQSGGTSVVVPFGASALSFTPSVTGFRFWQQNLRFTIPGAAPVAYDLRILAATN